MVYNSTLKREIPEDWDVHTLRKHLNCNVKKLGVRHNLKAINYLDTSSLTNNVFGETQPLVFGKDNIPSRAQMVVSQNDILYSTVRPNLLHYGLISKPVENMIASTGFATLNSKVSNSYNSFFYLNITSEAHTAKLVKISTSSKSSYPSISPDDILNLSIALPNGDKLLKKSLEVLNPIFRKIAEVQSENKELAELRDWLLPMLMNGQVTMQETKD